MDIYFILSVTIQLHFIDFCVQIVPALAIGNFFHCLLCSADIIVLFFFLKLSYFLVLKCARGLSRVFPAPVLESVISPES